MLEVRSLAYRVGRKEILEDVNAGFSKAKFHIILGPNGSGKSTLLKLASGGLKASAGQVFYGVTDIKNIDAVSLAKMRAVMSQESELHFPLSVYEIVKMGRYPFFDLRLSKEDEQIIEAVMTKMDLVEFAARDYNTLSGGEKQRVQFARVLAQLGRPEAAAGKFLFLDEAVSNLDLKHQQQLLDLAADYCNKFGVTVIAVLHDLNLSLRYGDSFFFLQSGRLKYVLQGKEELSEKIIQDIFEVESKLIRDETGELIGIL